MMMMPVETKPWVLVIVSWGASLLFLDQTLFNVPIHQFPVFVFMRRHFQ